MLCFRVDFARWDYRLFSAMWTRLSAAVFCSGRSGKTMQSDIITYDLSRHHLQEYKALHIRFNTRFGQCMCVCACLYQVCGFVHVMLLLVLFMGALGAEEDTTLCEMLGSPEYPQLSMAGDITIGGVFSIHSHISKPQLSFRDTPEPFMCSRYRVLCPRTFVDSYKRVKAPVV